MPEDKGNPIPEGQNPNPGDQDDNIPDWMKEAGWGKDSGTFDESKPVFDSMDNEDEIVPADIPAWLEEAAPDGFSTDPNATPAFEGLSDEGSYITTGDLIPRNLPEEAPAPSQEASPEPVSAEEPVTPSSEPELDIPSWLKNLELDEDSQETAVTWLENMPEELRATEEEIAASKRPYSDIGEPSEPESLEDPVDELAWIDEIAKEAEKDRSQEDLTQAELSEDLVASELIPEQATEEQIFGQEEIESLETETPDWLQELATDDAGQSPKTEMDSISSTPAPPIPQEDTGDVNMMPDWLSDLSTDEPETAPPSEPAPEPTFASSTDTGQENIEDIPDWLEGFDSTAEPEPEDPSGLDWLNSLAGRESEATEDEPHAVLQEETIDPVPAVEIPEESSAAESDVSPLDETLNTQVPDWLSKIAEAEKSEKEEQDDSSSWLDQIDKPVDDGSTPAAAPSDGEVMDWLENMEEKPEETSGLDDFRDALAAELEADEKGQEPVELESAKYFKQEEIEDAQDSMPDWLSEITAENEDESGSLESAIRHSEHTLSDEEKEFLSKSEEVKDDNADWLAKLDLGDDDVPTETEIPAIKVDLPDDDPSLGIEDFSDSGDSAIAGGILDRLHDPEEVAEPEIPQWLENLKREEDPQETAILWLKQFVERGNQANLQDEIKRYTDELDPGDSLPKWMEDLKTEEDPQTTAMLWLEKLAGERPVPKKSESPKEEVEAGWLAELEKEVSEQTQDLNDEPVKDFQDASEGWLADLEIDEKIKTKETELPEWINSETEETREGTEPSWMKATSPLEGDFHTDELAGSAEKEVEIPAWLAGYGEGEGPGEDQSPSEPEPAAEDTETDEYAWVSEKTKAGQAKPSKDPIDLNNAAISQFESILGISYQVAQGIVRYREKQGPYRELKDLLNVPEIKDEQTIEILKPEVFIKIAEEKPKTKPAPKPEAKDTSVEERFQLAKALLADSQIDEALEHYSYLIKKKKSIPLIIENLIQASADNPVDISILKTLGDAYMRIDKLDEALAAYTKAEELLH